MGKNILLISYYWPPDNSSGVQRWAYFAHYLHKLGYSVEVVTVDPAKASYKNTDDSFTELVKDIKVHKTSTFELLKAYSLITTGDTKKGIPRGSVDHKKSIIKKIANKVKADFFVPDARVGWNKYALKTAKKLVRENTILITTGPPQSTHLVGLKLKEIFPENYWIADLRDPWLELYSNQNQPQSKWAATKNARFENAVLTNADSITTIGPSMVKLLQNKITDKAKVHCYYNGYDAKKMDKVVPINNQNFSITFIGLLAEDYDTNGFIQALRSFVIHKFNSEITITLAGNIAPTFLKKLSSIDNIIVDYVGFAPHSKSLQLMKSASVLFTILPSQEQDEIIISGKMMEYLAAKKPILCIGNKKGDAAELINKCGAGMVVNHDEYSAMADFLSKCYHQEFEIEGNTDISAYSREQVALQFSSFLKTLD